MPSRHVGLEWLLTVYVAPMCGAYVLTAAFAFRALVAANGDLAARVYDWETAGAVREPRPQLRCCSFAPRQVLGCHPCVIRPRQHVVGAASDCSVAFRLRASRPCDI